MHSNTPKIFPYLLLLSLTALAAGCEGPASENTPPVQELNLSFLDFCLNVDKEHAGQNIQVAITYDLPGQAGKTAALTIKGPSIGEDCSPPILLGTGAPYTLEDEFACDQGGTIDEKTQTRIEEPSILSHNTESRYRACYFSGPAAFPLSDADPFYQEKTCPVCFYDTYDKYGELTRTAKAASMSPYHFYGFGATRRAIPAYAQTDVVIRSLTLTSEDLKTMTWTPEAAPSNGSVTTSDTQPQVNNLNGTRISATADFTQ